MTTNVAIAVVPANEANWDDLKTVFGSRGEAFRCQRQRYKLQPREAFKSLSVEVRAERLRRQTCLFTRAGSRRRGISPALTLAAVDLARKRGARALEGYLMIAEPGQEIGWGELHVGGRSVFAAPGFTEVSRPTPRRVVMRINF